jgi:hypothetical protein
MFDAVRGFFLGAADDHDPPLLLSASECASELRDLLLRAI